MTTLTGVTLPDPRVHRVPRLGDIVTAQGLKLALVSGNEVSLQRPVRGVHAIDLRHPGQWIDRDWVLLSTGSALANTSEDEQRDYILELITTGVTALGFGVGIVFDSVPSALLAAAAQRSFPIFTVAPETPFRAVISFANHLAYGAVTRRLELHSRLFPTIATRTPEASLTQGVAALLHRPVRLVDPSGHCVASEGTNSEADVTGSQHVVSPMPSGLRLIAPVRPNDGADEMDVLDVAREVLRLLGARDEFHAEERRRARAELVDEVLNVSASTNTHALERRLASYGIDPALGVATVIVEPILPGQDPLGALEALAYTSHAPGLLAHEGRTTVGLVQVGDGNAMAEFLGLLARDWHVGVGETFSALQNASASARTAEAALRVARDRDPRRGCVVTHTELGFSSWLLASMDPALVTDRARRRLAVLSQQPLLFEAVQTYLDCELSIAKAAKALFIHANSLRYRLARAELALGASLRNPEVISDLFLALRATRRPPGVS